MVVIKKKTVDEKIEIQFKLEQVSNKFLIHLKETTDIVSHIYYSIHNSGYAPNQPLPTNSLPLLIDDKKHKLTKVEQKQRSLDWIFKKAFEEFISGLTMSLIEGYRFVKLHALASQNPYPGKKEDLENEMENIDIAASKAHFPELMKHIEQGLGQSLPLRDEINSINKVRNCLVHRHGIVQQKDLYDANSDTLTLKWKSIKLYTYKDGQLKELVYETRKDGILIDNMQKEQIDNVRHFKLGDKITIDLNDFNGISFTCADFAKTLFDIMPRQKKRNKKTKTSHKAKRAAN